MYKVLVLGDFDKNYPPHIATNKSLQHISNFRNEHYEVEWIPTEKLNEEGTGVLENADFILAGPSPYKSKKGIFKGIQFARENNIPFLGTCGGMHSALAEFAVNVLKLDEGLIEISSDTDGCEQLFMQAICCGKGEFYKINVNIKDETKAAMAYNTERVEETSNCSFSFNQHFIHLFESNSMICSGSDDLGDSKIFELTKNDFFILTKFLPQMQSDEKMPHPIINKFLSAKSIYEKENTA
jgi:CTP synthase (UTP-ammonia lyase)